MQMLMKVLSMSKSKLICISFTQTVLMTKCTHLHTEMKELLALKHNGFTPYEMSQIILKLLTLLSATVTIDYIVEPTIPASNGASKVKTKKEDGCRLAQDIIHDLDVSNHANIDWDIQEEPGQVKTKTEDGGRLSDHSLKSSASQSSLDTLDVSSHANLDWGELDEMMEDVHVATNLQEKNRSNKSDMKKAKSCTDMASVPIVRAKTRSKRSTLDFGVDASNRSDNSLSIDVSNRSRDLNQRLEQIASAFEEYLEDKTDEPKGRSAFYVDKTANLQKKRTVSLQFDNMGYILGGTFSDAEINSSMMTVLSDGRQVIDIANCGSEGRIQHDSSGHTLAPHRLNTADTTFALPSPARESLLSAVVLLLNKKKELESVSNSLRARRQRIKRQKTQQEENWWPSFFSSNNNQKDDEWMLILNWQPLLRLLIRTAPFLQMNSTDTIKMGFLSNQSPLEKRTVFLITGSRKFFDQGMRPKGWTGDMSATDNTARELWHYVKRDLKPDTHPNSYFRALVTLFLFHPSDCSRQFYIKHMPRWMERWVGVNQTPEIDFLWVAMFTRARKFVRGRDYDWGSLKRHLEHVGPMELEDNRWNDRPARRMSGASSVMEIPIGLFDEMNDMQPPSETLVESIDEEEDEREKEDMRVDFMRGYNDGPRAVELENLPKTLHAARQKHFQECRRLSQLSKSSSVSV